ncbi:MAG: beta-propeller fold lactonase family protein [Pirellulales bacterium]|nr:beta-propeller fold lactonase family protein [Pirellulales bacterium]
MKSSHVLLFVGILLSSWSSSFAGISNSLMDISADGTLLICSNRDSGTATVVDLKTSNVLHEIPVGKHPEGVSFVGSSKLAAVAIYDEDKIVFIDTIKGELVRTIEVFDEPYGVVSTTDGKRLYVTLDFPGQVLELDPVTGKTLRTFEVGPFTRGVALRSDESKLYVVQYYNALVSQSSLENGKVTDQWSCSRTDNLARQLVTHPTREKVYVSHIRSKITSIHGQGSIFPYVSVVDSVPGEERRRKRIPMDAFVNNQVTANPWEVDITPDGKHFYVIFGGTNDMYVCNTIDDDYRELGYVARLTPGLNPRAIRVGPKGQFFYVYTALDFTVSKFSVADNRLIQKTKITENPLTDQVLAGKILFYSALQPMVARRWISCSSCHPDGQPDGRTWHNPEGLRNTQSFAGLRWTHPVHWSADRDEVQDFEHTIRGPLMGGSGLIKGAVDPSLKEPNRLKSDRLDALAAYTNSHDFTISPFAKNGLSDSATRGKSLFESEKTKCATCHTGPVFTDSAPVAISAFRMHDVGTGNDDESEKMGPRYDTPTLLGVYRSAPYLHHGKALTLHDVLTTENKEDKHGVTSHLSETQINDLVEFLKSLPYEDPTNDIKSSGIKAVDF